MLTTILLLTALAATVPDEVTVEVTPAVVEGEISLTATAEEHSTTRDESTPTERRDQSARNELPLVTPPAHTNPAPPMAISRITRAVPIDREVPVISILLPTDAAITQTAGTPVSISGTVTDDVGLSSVKWALTGTTSANGAFLTTGIWKKDFIALGVGTYTFRVTAVDTAGKSAVAKTRTITITRAATPPPTPPADDGKPETSGDIHKQNCGAGGGLAATLLLCGVVGLRQSRRRIE